MVSTKHETYVWRFFTIVDVFLGGVGLFFHLT